MREMINYAGEKIEFSGCPSCAFFKGDFNLPCGTAFKNEKFTLSQDWELPIPGFFVVSPTQKHIEELNELDDDSRNDMFRLVNKTIEVLKQNNVCDRFNIIMEEKPGVHFHIWIMPRHKWMEERFGKITYNIEKIFTFAKNNLKTKENLEKIKEISDILKNELKNWR